VDDHHFGYIIKWTKKKFFLREILPIKKEATSMDFFFSILSWKWIGNHPQDDGPKLARGQKVK
jgi:hypothetical protein